GQAIEPAFANRAQGVADRQCGDETELRRLIQGATRSQDQGRVEITPRRRPGASAPPSAGGLLEAPHQCAFCCTGADKALAFDVGAAGCDIENQPIRGGEPRLRRGHRANKAEAAASAPAKIGPGDTKKNSVTTAVTKTTPLSSALIGRSKTGAGSS